MKIIIDLALLTLSLIVFAYIIYSRAKYSNRPALDEKLGRENKLIGIIRNIKIDNKEVEELMRSLNFDTDLDDVLVDRVVQYMDNKEKLKEAEKELKKTSSYIRRARKVLNITWSFKIL